MPYWFLVEFFKFDRLSSDENVQLFFFSFFLTAIMAVVCEYFAELLLRHVQHLKKTFSKIELALLFKCNKSYDCFFLPLQLELRRGCAIIDDC